MTDANNDANGLGPPPAETIALWLEAIPTTDADVFESFVARMGRFWKLTLQLKTAIDRRALTDPASDAPADDV